MQFGAYSKRDAKKIYHPGTFNPSMPGEPDKSQPEYEELSISYRWNQFSKVKLIYNIKCTFKECDINSTYGSSSILFLDKSYQNLMRNATNKIEQNKILSKTD